MEVRDLQVFLSVAKHLNYTRAGEEVHLSQPSVSVRIKQLEAELGVKLFEQLGKKVALTEAGQSSSRCRNRILSGSVGSRHLCRFRFLQIPLLRNRSSCAAGTSKAMASQEAATARIKAAKIVMRESIP
jgi:DNA-binding transcriptional LysR family regulator